MEAVAVVVAADTVEVSNSQAMVLLPAAVAAVVTAPRPAVVVDTARSKFPHHDHVPSSQQKSRFLKT